MFLATKSNKQERFLIKNVIKELESVIFDLTDSLGKKDISKALDNIAD